MRKIAVIGSGQGGLLVAHALLQARYDVELYSDRSPEDWLVHGRPTGTAVRFARSLAYERRLGLTHGHDDAPRMEGLKVTICSHPGKPILALFGRFAVSPLAIDLRLQSAEWLRAFERGGGRVHLEKVSAERFDEIARENELTIVATGKDGAAVFERDAARSPCDAPSGGSRWSTARGRRCGLPTCRSPRRSSTCSTVWASATGRRTSTRMAGRSGTSCSRPSPARRTIASGARAPATRCSGSPSSASAR